MINLEKEAEAYASVIAKRIVVDEKPCCKSCLQQGYIDGYRKAQAPRWISISTPPRLLDTVLLLEKNTNEMWFGRCVGSAFVYFFGHSTKCDKEFTYWLPLPALPPPPEREA